jgi:hypothetical protein
LLGGKRVKLLVENFMVSLLDPEKIKTKLGYDELPDSKVVHHRGMAKRRLWRQLKFVRSKQKHVVHETGNWPDLSEMGNASSWPAH